MVRLVILNAIAAIMMSPQYGKRSAMEEVLMASFVLYNVVPFSGARAGKLSQYLPLKLILLNKSSNHLLQGDLAVIQTM